MKQYYKIADHAICIACDNSEVMDAIPGFSDFRYSYSAECVLCVQLCECAPEPIIGERFHYVETHIALCLLYHTDKGSGLEIKQDNRLRLSLQYDVNDRSCAIKGSLTPELLRYALWLAFNLSVIHLKTIAIHASSIVYHNNAFLYLGGSGTGKSTHTRLLCQYLTDVELLNDDSPILRVIHGRCFVYGSPWSGKTQCYKQKRAVLAGVVRLCQAPKNLMEQLSLHKAVGALLPSFPPELYLNTKLQYYVIDIMSNMLDTVQVSLFKCLPDKEAAEISIDLIHRYRIG